jgi:predicted DNA-binding protein with PD1-like motif
MREMRSGSLLAHAVRLEPGDDLVPCLLRAARMAVAATTTTNRGGATGSSSTLPAAHHPPSSSSSSSSSCVVLTAVGSLSSLTVRLANASSSSSPTRTGADSKPQDDVALTAANGESDSSCFRTWNECLEVTSLVGTFAVAADVDSTAATAAAANEVDSCVVKHLHITVSDGRGCAFGGHLVSGVVHTTLELVLGTIEDVDFRRVHDPRTGYSELVVTGPTTAMRRHTIQVSCIAKQT